LILLSAGHYPQAPGACNPSWCEHEEAQRWVWALAHILREQTHIQFVPTGTLTQKVKWINGYKGEPITIAAEIHFNSDPTSQGKGSETLYCPGSVNGKKAAELVQWHLGTLMVPNRGAKEGWYRMDKPGHIDYPGDIEGDEKPDYFLKATRPAAIILEPEFIHNAEKIQSNRNDACQLIARGLTDYISQL